MPLRCIVDLFERNVDVATVRQCGWLSEIQGVAIVPSHHFVDSHCNVTGGKDNDWGKATARRRDTGHSILIPDWRNRFSSHYSAKGFVDRIHATAMSAGLRPRRLRVCNWETIHPDLWLRRALVLQR